MINRYLITTENTEYRHNMNGVINDGDKVFDFSDSKIVFGANITWMTDQGYCLDSVLKNNGYQIDNGFIEFYLLASVLNTSTTNYHLSNRFRGKSNIGRAKSLKFEFGGEVALVGSLKMGNSAAILYASWNIS